MVQRDLLTGNPQAEDKDLIHQGLQQRFQAAFTSAVTSSTWAGLK
jgi:hypothetical protein